MKKSLLNIQLALFLVVLIKRSNPFSLTKKSSRSLTASTSSRQCRNALAYSSSSSSSSLSQVSSSFSYNENNHRTTSTSQQSSSLGSKVRYSSVDEETTTRVTDDDDALEKKNRIRKKFGLEQLTMEQFVKLQEQIAEIDIQQKEKALTISVDLERTKGPKERNNGFFNKLLGSAIKDTCESNNDCESPKICCDFGLTKMCCSSGMHIFGTDRRQSRYGELALVPVPLGRINNDIL